ncbi:MAG: tRNA (adenosine(37)-N6)-dimethylallyltransferase MiaA [Gammaproteobacteria bacterium]|nr:tRNA (adenosine(37)-N6)-dimethylallyltransferase MiaA [Gammaproteobacteria bacterium]
MGPTASGKTDLALALHDALPCGIVSVDSALVYRGMDIGTAKPPPEVLARVPHRLVDILDPAEAYSAGRFREDALAAMAEIGARGRTPLLVGGTMLYFRALARGLAELPRADPALREALSEEAARRGWPSLHRELGEVDPEAAAAIHPNDAQRIQRALEVYRLAGVPMSRLRRDRGGPGLPWRLIAIVVAPADRALLHARIAARFQAMLELGFLDEVRALRARGDLDLDRPSMRAVGYRQAWRHLDGAYDSETMIRRAVAATRQLAKRQLTWLRGEPGATWFEATRPDLAGAVIGHVARFLAGEGTGRQDGGLTVLE